MSEVKVGFNQIGQPAPLWWRRLERAYIAAFAPALSAFIGGWGFSPDHTAKALLIVTFSMGFVKGFGMILGNGQVYADKPKENEKTD
jgi:hypothetical protein